MDDDTWRLALSLWGAGLATLLGGIKMWETFWKDRLRLETTYSFTSLDELADEITIVNLSPIPVHVRYWSLVWRPNLFRRWTKPAIDVTPDEAGRFTIGAKDTATLEFSDLNKFDWSYRTAIGRKLYLTLHIFGRRRPKVLCVGMGQ